MIVEWNALLAIEDLPTTDRRVLDTGSLFWTFYPEKKYPFPPLMFAPNDVFGHADGRLGGMIRQIERHGNWILASGRYAATPPGDHLRQKVFAAALSGTPLSLGIDLLDVEIEHGSLVYVRKARLAGATVYLNGQRGAFPMAHILPA